MRTASRFSRRLHRYSISKQGTRSGRSPIQGFRQQHGRTGHAMDWRTYSNGRRSRRNNRVDNRNRWIVAEEGATFLKKNNTAIGHDLVQGFPFVRRNHQKQEESRPSLDSARKIDTPVDETTEFLRTGLACTRMLGQSTVEAGQLVLASRSNHPTSSLKALYDPKYMPLDLRQAHEELDKIVDVAFGADKWLKDDDNARLKVLFDSYRKLA